jgi:hypothetical protein
MMIVNEVAGRERGLVMTNSESYALGGLLLELTKGRPFVFVAMAYESGFSVYDHIATVVEKELGLLCIRADHVSGSGHDLLAKIHLLIERAELVIGEITGDRPNVYYEVGFAVGRQKPVLLLIHSGSKVPTDLQGREIIEYRDSKDGREIFELRLREHLRLRVHSQVPLLRDMLESLRPRPAYIVASPRYPTPTRSRILGQVYDRRTFSDNLGILGLISAFGSFLGEPDGIELIGAQYGPRDLETRDLNLYLIGSRKANPIAGVMLELLHNGRAPRWTFAPYPGENEDGDWRVALYRDPNDSESRVRGSTCERDGGIVHDVDHGIIVRGPHPHHPERLVMIMAGAHSLGTGAACLAATRSVLIRRIRSLLKEQGVDLADKHQTWWVLVRGTACANDGLLDVDGVEVLEAGCYGEA